MKNLLELALEVHGRVGALVPAQKEFWLRLLATSIGHPYYSKGRQHLKSGLFLNKELPSRVS